MMLKDVEVAWPYRSQYGQTLLMLEKNINSKSCVILRFSSSEYNYEGSIRLISLMSSMPYDVITNDDVVNEFTEMMFTSTIINNYGKKTIAVSSDDPLVRRKEIFDLIFEDLYVR